MGVFGALIGFELVLDDKVGILLGSTELVV